MAQRLLELLFHGIYSFITQAIGHFVRARIWVQKHLCRRSLSPRVLSRFCAKDGLLDLKLGEFKAIPGQTIWIHAVSLGEAKAVSGLIDLLIRRFPKVKFALSTSTETGFYEMSQIGAKIKACAFYLPIDTRSATSSLVRAIDPKIMLFAEGDIWLNLLRALSENKTFTAVVSAKISTRSARWLRPLKFCMFLYWNHLNFICAQSEGHKERLQRLLAPKHCLAVTGNLKLSNNLPAPDLEFLTKLKRSIGVGKEIVPIVLASTHEGEEQLLISALKPLMDRDPHLHLIIVPRHPARGRALAKALSRSYGSVTTLQGEIFGSFDPSPRLHLVEETGHLCDCYRMGKLAIVGGSFIKGIGGHNIFEPMLVPTPPIYGPHMENQIELIKMADAFCAGTQLTLDGLCRGIDEILSEKSKLEAKEDACKKAVGSARGSLQMTWQKLEQMGAFSAIQKQ